MQAVKHIIYIVGKQCINYTEQIIFLNIAKSTNLWFPENQIQNIFFSAKGSFRITLHCK